MKVVLCGDNNNSWKGRLQLITAKGDGKTIVIGIINTISSAFFIQSISNPDNILLIADEVHRTGSKRFRDLFQIDAKYRLGMSATPERYGDDEGTKCIFDYFGDVLEPEYSLDDAINSSVLCKYNYYPHVVKLNAVEQEKWDKISKKILFLFSKIDNGSGNAEDEEKLKLLYIQRSKIAKKAHGKLLICKQIIEENYKDGDSWVIYCDDQKQMNELFDLLSKYRPQRYHSNMEGDRKNTLSYFEKFGGILIAIKCFDEGVNIPDVSKAVILASSQNPREFIQRRGRVLRRSPNKYIAEIYDTIVVPNESSENKNNSILRSELSRAIEFAKSAVSTRSLAVLKNIATEYNIDITSESEWGFEDD